MNPISNKKIEQILAKKLGFEETMREIFLAFPIHNALGMSLDKVSQEDGCHFSITFYRPLTNIYGTVQGGAVMALDSAVWMSVVAFLGPEILKDNLLITVNTNCDFKIPVEIGERYTVMSRSSDRFSHQKGRDVVSGHALILTSDGREAALLYATKMIVPVSAVDNSVLLTQAQKLE